MLIIDGYNVLMQMPVKRKTLHEQREDLIKVLNKKHRLFGGVILVFDGKEEVARLRGENLNIRVIYTTDKSADEYIKSLLKKSKNPKALVVATDDKEIRDFAKIHGSRYISSPGLIRKIFPLQKRTPRYSADKEIFAQSDKGRAITDQLRKEWKEN